MIARTLEEIIGAERDVRAENGNGVSRRFVLDDDKAGFRFRETIIRAGTETRPWYKHHVEAVYRAVGEGEIEGLKTGRVHQGRHPIPAQGPRRGRCLPAAPERRAVGGRA